MHHSIKKILYYLLVLSLNDHVKTKKLLGKKSTTRSIPETKKNQTVIETAIKY